MKFQMQMGTLRTQLDAAKQVDVVDSRLFRSTRRNVSSLLHIVTDLQYI